MLHTHINQDTFNINILNDVHYENSTYFERLLNTFQVPDNINRIQIDLSKVNFIDSTGISFLVKWLYPLSAKLDIELTGATEPVKKILSICKMDQFVLLV
ncbi:STAS domain-containing protein [Peribacillus sp. NPDC097295]|uniref:STAS domain-containing protein n=1 Tax=Peribacillus sp. NPDC097295 TaxID=3364402 RepID=UPI003813C60F